MPGCAACGRALPAEGLPFCPYCREPVGVHEPGQRKTVSILFCDLVGSTVLGSSVDPEVLRSVLARYWELCRSVVERHGGTVEKFIGDAVVGVFGIPTLHEDDALRAVRAASDLLTEIGALNQDLQRTFGVELAVRIGVNTGEVIDAGSEALMAGDAANVAARLEQAAAPGEALLGEATRWLVRDVADAAAVDPLHVKGKAEPLVAFRLLGVRPDSLGQPRRRRFSGALVGRAALLRLAEDVYRVCTEESACGLLTVLGAPGVGKSRLVEEVIARLEGEPLVLAGRCLPYGEGITYWPTVKMLDALTAADPRSLSDWLSGVDHAELIMAGLDTMRGLAQSASEQEVAWAFRRLAETVAADRPVVLVVDDAQWAEPALLDLLDQVTNKSRGVRGLLVCSMARPELLGQRPAWGSQPTNAVRITLRALSPSECAELATDLLGPAADAGLVEQIVAGANGIPLFVEEMVAMLVDEGQLVADGAGGWRPSGELCAVAVPPSVQALIAARLDRLSPQLRTVVEVACVIGRTFYPEALAALVEDPTGLSEQLDALVRGDLIVPAATDLPGHEACSFTNLLTRDGAYTGLTKVRRAALHEAVARWLRSAAGEVIADEVMAFHLEQAATYRAELGEPDPALADEAARLLLTAADRALALSNPGVAGDLLARAAALASSSSPLGGEISLRRSVAAYSAGDVAAATRWADEAEQAGHTLGDQALRWRARLQRQRIRFWTDPDVQLTETFALTDQALTVLTVQHDDAGLAEAHVLRAEAHNAMGEQGACSLEARQAIRHQRRLGRPITNAVALAAGTLHFGEATLAEGVELFSQLETELGDDPYQRRFLDQDRLFLLAYGGQLDEARTLMTEQADLAREQGDLQTVAGWLGWGLRWCQRWGADLPAAVETLAEAAQLSQQGSRSGSVSTLLALRALYLAHLGRDDEAAEDLARSRALTSTDDLVNDIYHAATDGLLLAHRGDATASEQSFQEALRVVDTTEWPTERGEVWLAVSAAREGLGDRAGALAAAQAALSALDPKGFLPMTETAQARIAELTR